MHDQIKKSLCFKSFAWAFIGVILLGNLWMALAIAGANPPLWLMVGLKVGVVWSAISAAGCFMLMITKSFFNTEPEAGVEGEIDNAPCLKPTDDLHS
jgi:hypothetical protein